MKYDVHFYELLRVKIKGVEADSTQKAIDAADKLFQEQDIFDLSNKIFETELAEERVTVLVDPLDDKGEVIYEGSNWFDWPGHISRPDTAVQLLEKALSSMDKNSKVAVRISEFLEEVKADAIEDLPHPLLAMRCGGTHFDEEAL